MPGASEAAPVSTASLRVFAGAYRDSLLLLSATRAMMAGDGVEWATAVMALSANVADLAADGFAMTDLDGADANDLVLAVRAADAATASAALDCGGAVLFAEPRPADRDRARQAPRTLAGAVAQLPAANVAVVSVPGPYAGLAAHQALTSGLHVLLFSDNVPLEEEIGLKERASALGLLVMGPGAGTAVLGGVGLGFANAVSRGRVGVVAAAGTGAQEVMTLLDRWDIGVSHVIGVGGRDLTTSVGGRMAASAVRALDADPGTDAILLVSKPPDPAIAAAVVAHCRRKPLVAACVGMSAPGGRLAGAVLAGTLEEGARQVAGQLGRGVPDLAAGLAAAAGKAVSGLAGTRTAVRGFFTGGTLCYEAQVVLSELLGAVYSNIPLAAGNGLPAPAGAHICLDLGEEEFTQGRPHPMIDPAARREIMQEQALGQDVAVVLLDVVLGYGSHQDPAGEIAGTCADVIAGGAAVVAYVLGTRADPQGYDAQRAKLTDAGVIVTATAARAAHTAAAIAARQPGLAELAVR
jgi:FdrA protein